MTWKKIPVNTPFWSNAEPESKKAVLISDQRRDVMKDAVGSTIRRPALSQFATGLPEIADGMYYWRNADLVYIVSGGGLYSLSQAGDINLVQADIFEAFAPNNHVTWAESTNLELITAGAIRKLFATNGGRITEYDLTTAKKLVDPDAPLESSHIIMFDTYLHSNNLSDDKWDESIMFSAVADPITWPAGGQFYSAENHPDKLNAIHSAWDEIALFGEAQIENFYNDRESPFSSIPGGNINDGTLSPWTIKGNKDFYFYLNADRNVIQLAGRQAIEISDPIDDILDGVVDFENAEGDWFKLKGKELYLITINDRTFVYDIKFKEWIGEWGFWDKTEATYTKFKGRNFINVKPWGLTLCSDKDTGDIYKLDFDTYQDDGEEVRSSIITGWIDHGTSREKRSNELKLRLKRGQVEKTAIDQVEPKLLVRWADNGSDVFSNWREIPLGFQGDTDFYYSLFMLGSYRSRQYEFMCSDNTPFSIVEVEENVDLQR